MTETRVSHSVTDPFHAAEPSGDGSEYLYHCREFPKVARFHKDVCHFFKALSLRNVDTSRIVSHVSPWSRSCGPGVSCNSPSVPGASARHWALGLVRRGRVDDTAFCNSVPQSPSF